MNTIANVQNWHRYVLAGLGIIGLVLTGIITQPSIVPPPLHDVVGWAPLGLLIEGSIVACLPRAQLPTGPGAPPILSPPTASTTPKV